MNTATEEAPTEVASPEQKPAVETTPKQRTEADSQDARQRSRDPDRARAILRGEKPPEEKPEHEAESETGDETDAEVIARMFDPETGEFIEEEDANEKPAAGKATEKPKAKAEPAKTEAAEETGEDENPDPEEETEKKPEPKKRISVTRGRLGDRDFAIVQLADRENISLEDARQRLFGDTPAPKSAKAEEETPKAARETPEAIQAKITDLVEQRKAANKALDVDKATELTDQIAELKLQQREAQATLQQEAQSRATSHQEAVIASASKAVELYPGAAEEGNDLFEAIESARLDREKSDPSFFQNKNWPMVLAVEVATEMGVAPTAKKSAAEATPDKKAVSEKPAPTPKKVARPAPPNPAPGTATGAAKPNPEEALRTKLKEAKSRKDVDGIKAVTREIEALYAKR